MSKITEADSGAEGFARFAVGWLGQLLIKCLFTERKQIGDGLPCPFPFALPFGGEDALQELDDIPAPILPFFPFPFPFGGFVCARPKRG